MGAFFRAIFVFVLVVSMAAPANAKRRRHSHPSPSPSAHKRTDAEIEAATRVQVFLDRANFSPGKIDGHYNEFTLKALALYRESRGEPVPPPPPKPDSAPDLNGLDLPGVNPVFIQYTVTDADLQNIGPVPPGSGAQVAPEKAKLPALPYRDLAQEIAEKFHCDQKFLGELNPGKSGPLKPGDHVRVPNVQPFELDVVKNLKPGSELTADLANEMSDDPVAQSTPEKSTAVTTSVKVDVKTNMLGVFEAVKIGVAYTDTGGYW